MNGIPINWDTLTPGKQQQWLEQQPPATTKEESQERKRDHRIGQKAL